VTCHVRAPRDSAIVEQVREIEIGGGAVLEADAQGIAVERLCFGEQRRASGVLRITQRFAAPSP
jgi:hypothetical protein